MKKGVEFNLGLVIVLIIAILIIIWGVSFMISTKKKQEGIAEIFSEEVSNIGETFYEEDFLIFYERNFDFLKRFENG